MSTKDGRCLETARESLDRKHEYLSSFPASGDGEARHATASQRKMM
jgi:hypothetical protein